MAKSSKVRNFCGTSRHSAKTRLTGKGGGCISPEHLALTVAEVNDATAAYRRKPPWGHILSHDGHSIFGTEHNQAYWARRSCDTARLSPNRSRALVISST
jgi:hypothetical protein